MKVGDRVARKPDHGTIVVAIGQRRGTIVAIGQKPDIAPGFDIQVEWDRGIPGSRYFYSIEGLRPVSAVDLLADLLEA